MGISNYKDMDTVKQRKFNTLYRSDRRKQMAEQGTVNNYYTTHGAYGQPLPQRKDKNNEKGAEQRRCDIRCELKEIKDDKAVANGESGETDGQGYQNDISMGTGNSET